MLRAGTFIYALFIMFIVSMLTLLFLSQTRLYAHEISRMQVRERLEENCISAINYALAKPSQSFQQGRDFDLFGTEGVSIRKYTWGLMDVISVRAKHRAQQRNKTALLGYRPADSLRTALYLSNGKSALHISGETQISGNVFLPEAGVKRAYIAGASYFGDSLIYGKQFLSKKKLPLSIDAKGWDALEQMHSNEISERETIQNSFADSTIVITNSAVIYLKETTLKGNILISSDTLVEIYPSVVLEDVIVKAPVIKVKKGTRISVQLLAADTLIIEEDCVLHYPSVLSVRSEKRGFIAIAEDSKVYGDLWYKSGEQPGSTSIDVHIDEGASLTGRLMVERGNLQLQGKVMGEVYAEDLILHHPIGIYKNHLLSVQIDRRGLWKPYLFALKAGEQDKANVIKWLN